MTWDKNEAHKRLGMAMALEVIRRSKQGYDPCDEWVIEAKSDD